MSTVRADPAADQRVLFVCASLELGGAERQLSQLAPALRARGFEPAIVTIRDKGPLFDELSRAGVPTRFLPVRSRFDVQGVRNAVRAVGSWPDVVVSQGLDAQLVAHFIARRAGVAHVTVHHVPPELAISPHRRLLQAAVAKRVDCTIAVSSAQLANMAWLGFRPETTRVILNGVAAPRVSSDRSQTRAELGLGEQDFVALFAARLRPEKRVGVFIAAVEAAHAIDGRIRGVVAGAGDDLEAARAQAAASGSVTVLGERTDVPDLMVASDVVCLPSEAEALPMVIIEAMAVGRPVIATNVGGVSDVVLDGVTGIIVDLDPGETLTRALVTLAADSQAARAMGAAGRKEFEERFTLEAMVDHYAETLHEVAGRRAAGSRG